MVIAYVLITVKHGTNQEVVDQLSEIEEVKESHILYGQYDIICKIEMTAIKDLDNTVFKKIKAIPDVESTETLISSDVV